MPKPSPKNAVDHETPDQSEAAAIEERSRGLLVSGEVISRKRRKIELSDGSHRYCITFGVLGGGTIYHIDTWSATPIPALCPEVGTKVEQPVRLKIFSTKSGSQVKLEFGDQMNEEHF